MVKFYRPLLITILVLSCPACTTIGYYHQSISGHFSLISKRERIADIVNDSTRDEKLIEQLMLAQQVRSFASSTLLLPENDSYRSYVQLDKPFVTWSVFAAPEFSIGLQQWCFLVVGCVSYRGYFDEADAQNYADDLAKQGLDVYVAGVPAYSTLGWFDDPLLSTMIDRGEIVTASYIIHELAHQQLYLKGDSAFNEAFATAVEEIGVRKWLQQQQRIKDLQKYEKWLEQKTIFSNFIKNAQQEYEYLYAQELTDEEKRIQKKNKTLEIREQFANLTKQHKQLSRYSTWMSGPLNNAQFGAIALYRDLVPAFVQIFETCMGDFERFYQRVEEIAQLSEQEREDILASNKEC